MKLLNELQERRRVLCEARDVMRADLLQTEAELYDLYRAIGALEPAVKVDLTGSNQPEQTYTAQDFDTITIVEDPALTQDVIDALDDASEFSEEGYAPVIEAEPLADPIWNEPEPTKPEADSIAKALDHYDPKAMADRDRFNPFAMFRKEDGQ